MPQISLTASMRNNLLSLQNISGQVSLTQNRLATGKKVNSAIDNPSNFYTASSLSNRAKDLDNLLDAMSQAISTIKLSIQSMEQSLQFLEQARAISEQAMTAIIAENYKVVTPDMDADQIESLLSDGAKLILSGDITLNRGLVINAANITINGNGYAINYDASTIGESVIKVDGSEASADIRNIKINGSGEQLCAIKALNGGKVNLDNTDGINISGLNAQKIWFKDDNLYNGKGNTAAILSEVGSDALAATACSQFYVGEKNGDFGQSKWYLPAIGELMNVYGYDTSKITDGTGTSGGIGDNKTHINTALSILASKGVYATTLRESWYWSSSEYNGRYSWRLKMSDGERDDSIEYGTKSYVRAFLHLDNCFDPSNKDAKIPKVGDVMYDNKTWGSAEEYKNNSSAVAVGIITEVLKDGSVKIMSLGDLSFSNYDSKDNFDCNNPYEKNTTSTYHTTSTKYSQNITEIKNYDNIAIFNAFKSFGDINISFVTHKDTVSSISEQYNACILQYNNLLNDSSYKGINLLKNDSFEVHFNKDGSSGLVIVGRDMCSSNLGIADAKWCYTSDVVASLSQLKNAIDLVRNFVDSLSNNYSILTTRQDFTKNLINILTEGADKLTLADMNKESANMLALQTRQQLAINSLSLASQASQSVLKLF